MSRLSRNAHSGGMTVGRLLWLLPLGVLALGACRWRDSLLTVNGGTGAGGDAAVSVDAGSSPSIQSCPSVPGAPPVVAPLPTPAQVAYQRTELTAYVHFGLNTFNGDEGSDPPKDKVSLFNPDNLDANEWVTELRNAGFGQATLVAKTSTGFCLWPSQYTEFSVKNSPWRNGQGDVVKEFTDAMHAAGMRVGLYVAPLDDNYPSSSPSYETYLKNQLTELLTNYGPIYEIAFPGSQAQMSVDWSAIALHAHQLQPNVLLFMGPEIAGPGADIRYLGNQVGQANRQTSSVGSLNGGLSSIWYPAESPVSDRGPNTWFWHPNNSVISLSNLQSIYFTVVGMNATLIVNVPPATTGQFDTPDVDLLRQFGAWYTSLYQTNLVHGQTVTADSTWGNSGFEAAKVLDGDPCTYWAAGSGKTSARLEVTPAAAITFNTISIREPIELGERVTAYHIEIKQNGRWNKNPTDVSNAAIAGTVIGQRQLWQLGSTTADAIALVIDSAKDVPAIAEFGVYLTR